MKALAGWNLALWILSFVLIPISFVLWPLFIISGPIALAAVITHFILIIAVLVHQDPITVVPSIPQPPMQTVQPPQTYLSGPYQRPPG